MERVSTSSLLEDRRDACRALRSLSKKYRLEVGAQGIVAFIQILEQDRADCEIVSRLLLFNSAITAFFVLLLDWILLRFLVQRNVTGRFRGRNR